MERFVSVFHHRRLRISFYFAVVMALALIGIYLPSEQKVLDVEWQEFVGCTYFLLAVVIAFPGASHVMVTGKPRSGGFYDSAAFGYTGFFFVWGFVLIVLAIAEVVFGDGNLSSEAEMVITYTMAVGSLVFLSVMLGHVAFRLLPRKIES